jgi:GNAT superfamily N-acetyltransferase
MKAAPLCVESQTGIPMSLIIQTENPHDEICVELVRELSAELAPRYGDDGTARFTPDDVLIPRAAFVVAWLNGEAVGCGALRPMPDATCAEVKRMFVKPSARGQGISRKILEKLESLAAEYEYAVVLLETGNLQVEAVSLYQTSGYERTDCYEPYIDSPHSICYEKQLEKA